MKIALSTAFLSLAGLVSSASINVARQSCRSDQEFGVATVTPTTGLHIGDVITIDLDLTCTAQFGFTPTSIDYLIFIPANLSPSGAAQTVSLGSHVVAAGATSDSLTATIPNAGFLSGETYTLFFQDHVTQDGNPAGAGGNLFDITFA